MAEHRAAEAVKQWHSTGSDSTPKSISYNNVIPFAECRHETFEIRQIVRSCRTAGKVRKFNFEPGSNSMATIQPRQRLYDINNSGFLLAVVTNTLNDADDGHFKEVFCSFAGV